MKMTERIELMAHRAKEWPEAFEVYCRNGRDQGRVLAIGRDPLKASVDRLLEEGLAHPGSMLRLRYADNRPEITLSVSDARL
jgi:hypothetical protein